MSVMAARKYLRQVPIENATQAVKDVMDIIDAYAIALTLSGANGRNIQPYLGHVPSMDEVTSIVGENFRFNFDRDVIEIIFKQTIIGYDNVQQLKDRVKELDIKLGRAEFKPVNGRNSSFDTRLHVVYRGELDQEEVMKLFSLYEIK